MWQIVNWFWAFNWKTCGAMHSTGLLVGTPCAQRHQKQNPVQFSAPLPHLPTLSRKDYDEAKISQWHGQFESRHVLKDDLTKTFREGNGTPLQYSCLENSMDGGAWQAAVHGVSKSRTRLSDFTCTFHFHALEKEMATHSSVLAWRIPGTGSLVGCRLWGRTESDTTEAT